MPETRPNKYRFWINQGREDASLTFSNPDLPAMANIEKVKILVVGDSGL